MIVANNDFKNKTALITGGSFGIGRATAIAFANKSAMWWWPIMWKMMKP